MSRPVLLVGIVTLAAAGVLLAQELAPIPLVLPKPLFVGTPVPFRVANLERPSGVKRPPFLAPAGTTNLARGRPVTSSDPYPIIGEIPLVTDGDKSGNEGSYVELTTGLQWVQIDLGAPATLYAVVCWHFHAQPRAYHDVVVQASDDPDFKTGITTLFNNDHDDSAGFGAGGDAAYVETSEGRLIDAKGVRARHLRLYSRGNTTSDLNHYVEVEAFGRP